MMSANPVPYLPQYPRLLDQLPEVLRCNHYSLRTEEASLYWVKFFVRWYGRNAHARHQIGLRGGKASPLDQLSALKA